ncbi:MAG: malto-oligosyltrehalose trehalohydrolase [Prosthecobacter sp.]
MQAQPALLDEKDHPCHAGAGSDCLGAEVTRQGTCYKLWAPVARSVKVVVLDADGHALRTLPLQARGDGCFEALDVAGKAGDRYKYRVDEREIPDPASRFQPEGPHGASMVIDASAFQWSDDGWERPGLRDLILYELHVGTFTAAGTFRAAMEKLPHVKDLGANAIELMPLAEFAGARNWGYDGVGLFAPEHDYGHPDDLRALVNEAHRLGLAVILDVVYNHFGPDGNYLGACIGGYLDEELKTPWGGAIRYGHPDFAPLRKMLVSNVRYWMRDFHMDGFRLDATHAIADESPVHVLQEVTGAIHAEGGIAIAEDSRNDARICEPRGTGGMGFDAVWADDFHHVLRVSQTHETAAYFRDYKGSADELHDILDSGWLYRGQQSASKSVPRGTPCLHLDPTAFVVCISNHDQVGNRALGERLHQSIAPAAYRALSALLCLSPFTPMLFMGQEWAADSPFMFFTDHEPALGALITAGRRQEFAAFPEFSDKDSLEGIPDPQAEGTFARSKLRWEELREKKHAQVLALYRECLRLRRKIPLLCGMARRGWRVERVPQDLLALHYDGEVGGHTLIIHLGPEPAVLPVTEICRSPNARFVLSSHEARFGGLREGLPGLPAGTLHLSGPEVILLEW